MVRDFYLRKVYERLKGDWVTKWNSDIVDSFNTRLDGLTPQNVLDLTVPWNPSSWLDVWNNNPALPGNEIIAKFAVELAVVMRPRDATRVSRQDIFTLAANGPLEAFLGAIVFGYNATDPRGPWRLTQMLQNTPNIEDIVQNTHDHLSRGELDQAYKSMWKKRKGKTKAQVRGCSTSFVTKFLYFAGYELPVLSVPGAANVRPLIFDQRVCNALARLPTAPVVSASPNDLSTHQYVEYCRWCESTALQKGTDAAAVEYALFRAVE